MKITKEWLKEKDACTDGTNWFLEQKETDGVAVVEKLVTDDKLDWANWLVVRLMKRNQCIAYAIYAAEQVIEIYEKKHPEDTRPRLAIEAAKMVLENDTKENRDAAYAATRASYAAARAADADYAAASAADAADAAARADYASARAAASAAAYAADAARAADAASYAADVAMKKKIIMYGVSLLKGE